MYKGHLLEPLLNIQMGQSACYTEGQVTFFQVFLGSRKVFNCFTIKLLCSCNIFDNIDIVIVNTTIDYNFYLRVGRQSKRT